MRASFLFFKHRSGWVLSQGLCTCCSPFQHAVPQLAPWVPPSWFRLIFNVPSQKGLPWPQCLELWSPLSLVFHIPLDGFIFLCCFHHIHVLFFTLFAFCVPSIECRYAPPRQGFCLVHLVLCGQCLGQCLTHSRHFKHFDLMNQWIKITLRNPVKCQL